MRIKIMPQRIQNDEIIEARFRTISAARELPIIRPTFLTAASRRQIILEKALRAA